MFHSLELQHQGIHKQTHTSTRQHIHLPGLGFCLCLQYWTIWRYIINLQRELVHQHSGLFASWLQAYTDAGPCLPCMSQVRSSVVSRCRRSLYTHPGASRRRSPARCPLTLTPMGSGRKCAQCGFHYSNPEGCCRGFLVPRSCITEVSIQPRYKHL